MVVPWSLDVASDLAGLLEDEARGDELVRSGIFGMTQRVRERIFAELGVPVPAARVRISEALPEQHVVISLFEVPARVLSFASVTSSASAVLEIEASALALIRSRAADFLGIAETQHLLDQLEQIARRSSARRCRSRSACRSWPTFCAVSSKRG